MTWIFKPDLNMVDGVTIGSASHLVLIGNYGTAAAVFAVGAVVSLAGKIALGLF